MKPFGVASDIRVAGEAYSRSTAGRFLPDVGVLNRKKQAELVVDSLVAQSPLVMKGRGFVKPIGRNLRPWQLLHIKENTELGPLFDNNSLYQRTRSIYESELETLRQGTRQNKMDVALSDRMSATEYQQRQDASWGIFQPTADRIFEGMASPILKATLNYAIMQGLLPQPPDELVDGASNLSLTMLSAFMYGQPSERGQNLARALAPIAAFAEKDPEFLESFNKEKFLAASFADLELSEFVRTKSELAEFRQQQMERMRAAKQSTGQIPPEQKAQDQVLQTQQQQDIAGERILEYHGLF